MEDRVFELEKLTDACPGWEVDFHLELPSTNDHALRLAAFEDTRPPLLVLTQTQTAGRGRGRNQWWSAAGALTFSALVDLPADVPPGRRPQLSLLVALAIRESLAELVSPAATVQVKWPNDVYLDGRKVCGILIETSAARTQRAVVGIGINVNNSFDTAPPELRDRAIALCQRSTVRLDTTAVLIDVVRRLEHWLERLRDSAWPLSEIWRPHCLLRDRIVQLEQGGRRSIGRCLGIDQHGALSLQTATGPEAHVSGVVVSWE